MFRLAGPGAGGAGSPEEIKKVKEEESRQVKYSFARFIGTCVGLKLLAMAVESWS